MAADPTFVITYWGTTGSLSAPVRPLGVTERIVQAVGELIKCGALAELAGGPGNEEEIHRSVQEHLPFYLRSTYGGNTTCIEIETPDALLVIDSGSGFRELGIELSRRWSAPDFRGKRQGHVLITHAHMDHICGTPFVDPYYDPQNDFTIWAPRSVLDSLEALLGSTSKFKGLYFAPTFESLPAIRRLKAVQPGGDFQIGQTRIATHPLVHPGGCIAYRLERAGRRVVFASDHEHQEVPDQRLAEFARGADLFYADAQYLKDEYEGRVGILGDPPRSRRGWGHSWVEACVATAAGAGVRRLHLGHHEPRRSDVDLERIARYAQDLMRKTLRQVGRGADECEVTAAHEELTLEI